jgi:hypothetical protein
MFRPAEFGELVKLVFTWLVLHALVRSDRLCRSAVPRGIVPLGMRALRRSAAPRRSSSCGSCCTMA